MSWSVPVEASIVGAAATRIVQQAQYKGPVIIELTARDVADGNLPGEPPDWLTSSSAGIEATGADSLQWEVFTGRSDEGLVFATELETVAEWMSLHQSAEPSPLGVSQLLGSGLVPLPHTIYRDVFRVGSGDRVRATADAGRIDLSFSYDYPYLTAKSRHDQQPSTEVLLELLVASLERQLESCGREGLFLMSSGKDSMAVAVALAEMGLSIPAVTYRPWATNVEPEFAAGFCKRLGLSHQTVTMPSDPAMVRRHLTAYFETAPAPLGDHAIIPVVMTVAESGVDNGGIIDGSGNDPYMGFLPTKRSRNILRYRIRGRVPAATLARLVRFDSKLSYLTRTLAASTLPGRNLRNHEIQRIYRDAVDIDDYWYRQSRALEGMTVIDAVASSLVRQTEGARGNDKARLVAASRGMKAVLPFHDEGLAEYYFNLPVGYRYDVGTDTNKILLRQLLAERLGYDEAVVGKGYFAFDGPGFMTANAAFVRDEINSCSLWTQQTTTLVESWLEGIDRRPFVWHALLSLFMLSGWYNHSRYVTRDT